MPFADELLGRPAVDGLAAVLRRMAPERDWSAVELAAQQLADLGLSDRARAVGRAVVDGLPPDVDAAEAVIDAALAEDDFTGWMIWPVTEAVADLTSAAEPGRFDQGLGLLVRLTPRLSSEFALRHFLNRDLARTLDHALRWTRSPDEHVRRLASEGTRPRLPWARGVLALQADPGATTDILDALHQDPSPTVRRSVANHLNDVSRLDPALAVATASRWAATPDATTPAVVRHAMRTLVKQADPGALALLGFGTPDGLEVTGPVLDRDRLALGDALAFTATVTNRTDTTCRVAIDYVVHFRKANGSSSPKVFKLAQRTLAPGGSADLRGRHVFRELTTRRHHAGQHALEIQVNGRRHGYAAFTLHTG